MTQHVALRCKPSTQRSCRHILDRFLLPRFGALRLGEITPDHVAALHYRLRETPIMANQMVSLLSRLFLRAAASGNAPPGGNPCRFIRKYPARSRERFLSEQEYDRRRARRTRRRGPGPCQRHRGDPLADRLPAQRNPHSQMGGCRPRTRRAPVARREDRSARGSAVADGERSAHRHPPAIPGSSSGADPERTSPISTRRGRWPAARPDSRTCGFTTFATALPAGRSRSARACRRLPGSSATARPPPATPTSRGNR